MVKVPEKQIMFNRLGNCKNVYQGKAKRVLCVCSAGLLRSPTAANVLHREFGFNTRAAGLSEEFALIVVDPVLLLWADEIVCMNMDQRDQLFDLMDEADLNRDVVVLDVPDCYEFMNEELQQLITKRYKDSLIMKKAIVND